MARSWEMYKASRKAKLRHPLLTFNGDLAKASNANAEQLAQAGKSQLLSLAVGDPALDGNLPPPEQYIANMVEHIESTRSNGYVSSLGTPEVRQAIAEYWMNWFAPSLRQQEGAALTGNDVVVSSGCSDAASLIVGAMAGRGDAFLVPQPYFAQYRMLFEYYAVTPIFYNCDAKKDWEVDLEELQGHIDEAAKTGVHIRGILLNNPCNPCGSNWRRQHVLEIVQLCEKNSIPIVSDEIYAGMTFDITKSDEEEGILFENKITSSTDFTSVADVGTNATRYIISGASKRFSIPGDRFGWIIQVDPLQRGSRLFAGCRSLTSRFLLPHTAIQHSMVTVLRDTTSAYFDRARQVLKKNAKYLYENLSQVKGLTPIVPAGGMFMSVLLNLDQFKPEDGLKSGVEFSILLAAEENVHVFPGEPFNMPNAFRLTISRPDEITIESVNRIRSFCERHTI